MEFALGLRRGLLDLFLFLDGLLFRLPCLSFLPQRPHRQAGARHGGRPTRRVALPPPLAEARGCFRAIFRSWYLVLGGHASTGSLDK